MSFPLDVYIGAGSNIEPEQNLRLACAELRATFGWLDVSPVYRSAAVGFDGADFWNMAMRVATSRTLDDVGADLERIHDLSGRERSSNRFAPRTLDLDILLFGERITTGPPLALPRDDLDRYAFVLAPMADLAPLLRHPLRGKTMRELWEAFIVDDQSLTRLDVVIS